MFLNTSPVALGLERDFWNLQCTSTKKKKKTDTNKTTKQTKNPPKPQKKKKSKQQQQTKSKKQRKRNNSPGIFTAWSSTPDVSDAIQMGKILSLCPTLYFHSFGPTIHSSSFHISFHVFGITTWKLIPKK